MSGQSMRISRGSPDCATRPEGHCRAGHGNMKLPHKQAAYWVTALAVLSGLTTLINFEWPSSAVWLNHHGLIAWPLAILMLILFIWAASNWYQSEQQLEARAAERELVPEDRRLFESFKQALPKNSRILAWLRDRADSRTFLESDIAPLRKFHSDWKYSDLHFINAKLDVAVNQLIESAGDFLTYQASQSWWAPRELQNGRDDPMFEVYDYMEGNHRREREVQKGLGEHADKILAAHHELYMVGSRLGL